MFDAIIVGGGPAGLSAALILGRCLRKVLVCDAGNPRNLHARALHGFLTRDGIPPTEFLKLAREELKNYQTVEWLEGEVTNASRQDHHFSITLSDGRTFNSRKLLLATGVVDEIPKLPGIMELYGKSVHNCPYCDGWEERDKKLAVYGKGSRGSKLALSLKLWSGDVILFTDGPSELTADQYQSLEEQQIRIYEDKITKLEGEEGKLRQIVLENGNKIEREALYFNTESFIRSRLLDQLGCPFDENEGVDTGKYERTKVPGLFVAGNILREVQLVIVAAAQGAEAAFGINTALSKEDLSKP